MVKGRVASFTRHYTKKTQFVLECREVTTPDGLTQPVRGRVQCNIYGFSGNQPGFGDWIELETTLRSAQNFENPGAFDYARFFRLNGLSASAYGDLKKIRIISDKQNKYIWTGGIRNIEDVRTTFYQFVLNRTGGSEGGKAMASLITGKKEVISPDMRDLFSKAGISHLFAISGLHLSIIGFLFFSIIFNLLSLIPRLLISGVARKAAGVLTLIPLVTYSVFSGFSPSTQRAFVMTAVLLLAWVSEKEKDLPSSLSLAGILILISDAAALFSISFQLSFIAVIFIVCGLSLIRNNIFFQRFPILGKGIMPAVVTFWAALGTFPLTAHYFHTISLVQLIANLFFIPIIGFVLLPSGIVALFFFLLYPSVSGWVIDMGHSLMGFSIQFCDRLVSFPYTWIRIKALELPDIIILYLSFALFYTFFKRYKKGSIIIAVVLCVMGVYRWINPGWVPLSDKDLSITVLDVGQGNSAFIRTPEGYQILVDGGGFFDMSGFDTGRNILAPFLWKNRIDRLDYVILSHPESDHMNGLIYILNNFKVHTLVKNTDSVGTKVYEKLMEACIRNHTQIWEPSVSGERLYLGKTRLYFLDAWHHPPTDSLNDRSLAFTIAFKRFSMLFPGDIMALRERHLASAGHLDLKADVLLSPHHGSLSSSTGIFLEKVRPESVIISCGRDNRYRFPHADILKRYRTGGIRIYRTDTDGAVFITSDGNDYRIVTHKGG